MANLDSWGPSWYDNSAGNVGCCGCPGHGLTMVTRGVGHDHPGLLSSLHNTENTIQGSCQKHFLFSPVNLPNFTLTDW